MEVGEILGFDKYWRDPRFIEKKPAFRAGIKRKIGDNIYKPLGKGKYLQLSSAHSRPRFGKYENRKTMETDLSGKQVLISEKFVYFGSEAVKLPNEFRAFIVGRGHRCRFQPELIQRFVHRFVPKWTLGVHAQPRNLPHDDDSVYGGCDRKSEVIADANCRYSENCK
jgi:hypothetical protein